jgi:hypothetical protein
MHASKYAAIIDNLKNLQTINCFLNTGVRDE